jgi:hypothetical protein
MTNGNGVQRNGRSLHGQRNGTPPDDDINGTSAGGQRSPLSTSLWREEPASPRQLAYLRQLDVDTPDGLTRGQASDLIGQARQSQRRQTESVINGTASGQAQPLNPDLANETLGNRFAGLEQALTALTESLTNPDGTGRMVNGQVEEPSNEAPNGPIPDWLQEEDGQSPDDATQDVRVVSADPDADDDGVADKDEIQNVNIVSAAPDLDHDGREDKHETARAITNGTIHLEAQDESRQQVIHSTIERLQEPDSVAGQAAHRTLVVYTGQRNADLIQGAVGQHMATAVQEATTATANLVAQYQAQGMDDAAVLAAFQSGEAAVAIREALTAQGAATPISDTQLSAVADMVLLPRRRLTRTELVNVIGQQVAAGATNEQAIVQAVGSPVGFGGQTGNVRGVMAGARAMNLSPADLVRLAELLRDGLRETVQEELVGRGHQPAQVREFVSDMAALPSAMVLPQSTAVASTAVGVTAVSSQETQEG